MWVQLIRTYRQDKRDKMFPGRNKPAPIDIPPTYAELFPDNVTQEDIDLEQRNIENRLQTHAQRMAGI